jgi:hypothetical protein
VWYIIWDIFITSLVYSVDDLEFGLGHHTLRAEITVFISYGDSKSI